MGICVMAALAAFAISAMAASSASAGTYYTCVAKKKSVYTSSTCATVATKKGVPDHKGKFEKEPFTECVAQKKGEYTNATCTGKSAKAHKGKYEKKAGIKTVATSGKATLETPAFGKNNVECSSSTTTGEITGPKSNTEVSVFNGCKFEGLPCKTVGAAAEELKTNPETTTLVDHGEKGLSSLEPATGEVWNDFSPKSGIYFIEFECGGVVKLRTTGSVSGVFTSASLNKMSTTAGMEFGEGKGEQDLLTEAEEGSGWVGPAPSLQIVEGVSITNASLVEVRS
jgi:hypothetical protein